MRGFYPKSRPRIIQELQASENRGDPAPKAPRRPARNLKPGPRRVRNHPKGDWRPGGSRAGPGPTQPTRAVRAQGLRSSRQREQLPLDGHPLIPLQVRDTDRSPAAPHIPGPQAAPLHVGDDETHLIQHPGAAGVGDLDRAERIAGQLCRRRLESTPLTAFRSAFASPGPNGGTLENFAPAQSP